MQINILSLKMHFFYIEYSYNADYGWCTNLASIIYKYIKVPMQILVLKN